MNRINKAKKIGKILDKLYPETPVPLNHSDEYTLLVAVMLSAQTTDKKVNEVSPKLFRKAGNPIAMIELGEQKIKEIIKEIGLAPTKAKNLVIMANQIVEGGGLRADWEFLESLAGVGIKQLAF